MVASKRSSNMSNSPSVPSTTRSPACTAMLYTHASAGLSLETAAPPVAASVARAPLSYWSGASGPMKALVPTGSVGRVCVGLRGRGRLARPGGLCGQHLQHLEHVQELEGRSRVQLGSPVHSGEVHCNVVQARLGVGLGVGCADGLRSRFGLGRGDSSLPGVAGG